MDFVEAISYRFLTDRVFVKSRAGFEPKNFTLHIISLSSAWDNLFRDDLVACV